MSNVIALHTTEEESQIETTEPYLVFTNNGVLDINFIRLLGVSVKENDNPIGFFGTGLKYAAATALRLGGKITIVAGEEVYNLHSQSITIRGQDFQQVMLNNEPLGFTTELGKQWEAWQVVRELYSNTLDENGQISISQQDFTAHIQPEATTIMLYGQAFIDVWNKRSEYFIDLKNERPAQSCATVDAYAGGNCHAIFYRGICVHTGSSHYYYRYNIKSTVTLTEDRTLKYMFSAREAIERLIITSNDYQFIERVLSTKLYGEADCDFTESTHKTLTMSPEFQAVCKYLADNNIKDCNEGAVRYYKNRTTYKESLEPFNMSAIQEKQLAKAVDFLQKLGYSELIEEYEIVVVKWLGADCMGRAENGRVYLSRECFERGTKYLTSTILEELIHLKYGYADLTRSLQTFLFDRIITMGEEYVTGEAL